MNEPCLFSDDELKSLTLPPLTQHERTELAKKVISDAKNTVRYMYDTETVGRMIHKTKDEMQELIHMYRLDAIRIRTSIRIPWWSLAEYLLDEATDVDRMFYKWLKSLPHKPEEGK